MEELTTFNKDEEAHLGMQNKIGRKKNQNQFKRHVKVMMNPEGIG